MERAVDVFTRNFPQYVTRAADRILAAAIPAYANVPRATLEGIIARAFGTVKDDIEHGTCSAYPDYLREVGAMRAQQGVAIRDMIAGLDHGFQVVSDDFQQLFAEDLAARLWWEERRRELGYAGAIAVNDAYYTAREALILEQNAEILRLAAPIVPLYEGVLLMPLVGAISAERGAHILESLLDGIARARSQAVILDVTGMHASDESATDHLIRAARAARLLGATVILVGISAEIAMTFTKAGADLRGITILGDLKSGVEHALRLRGRVITSLHPGRDHDR